MNLRHSACAVSILGVVTSIGCGASPSGDDDPRGPERVASTEQALSSSVAFTLVGQPKDARRIAGCQDGRLYALNADKSLWISPNGADGTWTWVNTPLDADQIACAATGLYALNVDRSLWRFEGPSGNGSWQYVGHPGAAARIGGNFYLYALNDDRTLWRSPDGSDGSWTYLSNPAEASRITAGARGNSSADSFNELVYALNDDKSLWANDGAGAPLDWSDIGTPWAATEISGGAPNQIYALNTDFTLWVGAVSYAACGGPGQPCCDGNWCASPLACNGTCGAAPPPPPPACTAYPTYAKCGDACIYVGDVCPSNIPTQDLACALCIDCTGCTATETPSPLPKSKTGGNLM